MKREDMLRHLREIVKCVEIHGSVDLDADIEAVDPWEGLDALQQALRILSQPPNHRLPVYHHTDPRAGEVVDLYDKYYSFTDWGDPIESICEGYARYGDTLHPVHHNQDHDFIRTVVSDYYFSTKEKRDACLKETHNEQTGSTKVAG